MKYDVILFDADDTLFDYGMAEGQAFLNVFTHFGLPAGAQEYADSYQEINRALWADLEAGQITPAALRVERFNRLFMQHNLQYNPEEFSEAYLRFLGEGTFLIQGAVELCGALEGCRLAIITNGFKDVQLSRIQGSPLARPLSRSLFRRKQAIRSRLRGSLIMPLTSLACLIKAGC